LWCVSAAVAIGGDLGPGRMRSITSMASSGASLSPWVAGSLPPEAQQRYPAGVAPGMHAGGIAAGSAAGGPFRAPSGLPRSSSPAGPLAGSLAFGSGASSTGAGSNRASFDSSTAASTGEPLACSVPSVNSLKRLPSS